MKPKYKIILLISSIFIFLVCVLLFSGSFFLYKVISSAQGTEMSYFQTLSALATKNADGVVERKLKESSLLEEHRHVSIYYTENFSEFMPSTIETLDLAIAKNGEIFGRFDEVPVDLMVFDDKEQFMDFSGLTDVDGAYSDFDKVLAIHYSDESDKSASHEFQKLLLHEYNHYAFNRKSQDQAAYPMWFIEGVAEYAAVDPDDVYFPNFESIPFPDLNSPEQGQAAREVPTADAYLQSYYALEFLTSKFGQGVIKEIMESVNETRDFEESLKTVTGLETDELDRDYLNVYLK